MSSPKRGSAPSRASVRARPRGYGLKHLSLHIRDKVHVVVFQHSIWKSWAFMAAHERFPDLSQGLEHEDFDQVRLLLFDRKEIDSNPNRRAFQKDTQSKADQAALLARPDDIMDLQRHIDEDTRDVLSVAGTRMDILLRCKDHFLHTKPSPEAPVKVPLVQQKRALLNSFLQDASDTGHQWTPFRSGVQCSLCRQRFHTKSLLKELQEGLRAPCLGPSNEARRPASRSSMISSTVKEILDQAPTTYAWKKRTSGVRCAGATCLQELERNLSTDSWEKCVTMDLLSHICGWDIPPIRCPEAANRSNVNDATRRPSSGTMRFSSPASFEVLAKSTTLVTFDKCWHESNFVLADRKEPDKKNIKCIHQYEH